MNRNTIIGLGFILFTFIVWGCESRSDFRTESHSNQGRSSQSEEIKEKSFEYKEKKSVAKDTVIYERPQEQGGFLSAPDAAHQLLWGNKGDRPVRSLDSNVVLLSFIIEPDSTASSVKVLKGINLEMDSMAIQAVKDAKWKPGYVNDRPVRSRFAFPVVF